MKLESVVSQIDVWHKWLKSYQEFVPQFIEEAKTKKKWQDWNQEIFYEFFERSNDQCVSSLRQGYFTKNEKENIKNNWSSIAPILERIANSQDTPLWDEYLALQNGIRNLTESNRKAATYRLIASIQPNLLCTVVNENNLRQIYSHLRNNIDEQIPEVTNNWFNDSYQLWQFFKDCLPHIDPKEMVTYPWQTKVFFEDEIEENNDMSEGDALIFTRIVDLLKYKKQIILQGPPGTGKTRLAKELANHFISLESSRSKPKIISEDVIKRYICVGQVIKSAENYTEYTIINIGDVNITIRLKNSTSEYKPSFKEIINAYEIEMWKGKQKKGNDPYSTAIAKYIYSQITINQFKLEDSEQFKIVQFHPSYTYEDFVRGIIAEPYEGGSGILYKPENKLLGEFSKTAFDNWHASKNPIKASQDSWLENTIDGFIVYLGNKLDEEEGKIMITEKAYITRITENSIRYNGESWGVDGGVPILDIKKMYQNDVASRNDIINLNTLTKTAKHLPSYWFRIYELFKKFISDNKLKATDEVIEIEEKSYILIIDEINRANLSSVLGELIYALEYRGEKVMSMYKDGFEGSSEIILPPNLYIIGTMNTADRSVGHIDYAIRRRFGFVDVLPEDLSDQLGNAFDSELFGQVSYFFNHSTHLSKEFDPKDVQLGHSYFIDKTEEGGSMDIRLRYEIKPMLLEYVKDGILIGEQIVQKIEAL